MLCQRESYSLSVASAATLGGMATLAAIIQSVLDRTGIGREDLGIALGYSQASARQTIYKILAGQQRWLARDKLQNLVEKFEVDPNEIVSLPSGTDAPIRTKRLARSAPKMADFQGDDDIIPVFAFSVSEAGDIVKRAVGSKVRPPLLQAVRDAYAIYMPDESMEPRYRQGWLLWINPVKPVSEGRDALIFPKGVRPLVRQIERARGKLIGRALKRGAPVTVTEETNRHLIVGADQEG